MSEMFERVLKAIQREDDPISDFGHSQTFSPPNAREDRQRDRKSTRLNSSHGYISYAVFCLKKKTSFLALFEGDARKVARLEKMVEEKLGFKAVEPITGQKYTRTIDAQIAVTLANIAVSETK